MNCLQSWEQGSGKPQRTVQYYRTVGSAAAKLLQLCLTLCDPIDGSPPGSSVHGILQARILEWVAISFSTMGSSCHHRSEGVERGGESGGRGGWVIWTFPQDPWPWAKSAQSNPTAMVINATLFTLLSLPSSAGVQHWPNPVASQWARELSDTR